MSTTTETIRRVYRDTITRHGAAGVKRENAIEEALTELLAMHETGSLALDAKRALRAELMRADEHDGKSADGFLKRMAIGGVPLIDDDLDVVVTLGAGLRKLWRDVTATDIASMVRVRRENYRAARASYQEFESNAATVQQILAEHRTVGDATAAGAFQREAVGA